MRNVTPSHTLAGVLLTVSAALLFVINGTVSKVVLLNGLSSLELVSVRSTGTTLLLLSVTVLRNPAALRVGRHQLRFLVRHGITSIAIVQWLYFVAIQRIPVGIALLFEYTAPQMMAMWCDSS